MMGTVQKVFNLWLLVTASWDDGRWGLHVAEGALTCPSEAQPLLWQLSEGGRIVYIAGTYRIPASDLEPLESAVEEAISCADVAYFSHGCSLDDTSLKTGIGNYMAHCNYYPVVDSKDAIADRLSPAELTSLQSAIGSLGVNAPATCKPAVAELQTSKSISSIADNTTYRTTLLELYHKCVEAINPLWCSTSESTSQDLDSYVRKKWGTTKPIFGLEDISVECQVYQGNTVSQDQELATHMISKFNNAEWITNVSNLQGSMQEVMKCGDLTGLTKLMTHMENLPLASERMLQTRNDNLKFGIEQALKSNPGKKLLFAIPVTHLVDTATKTGVLSLLKTDGIQATRVTSSASLSCQASTYSAPGAAALGHCLKPPAQSQPASCIQFEQQFDQILGPDILHGRTKTSPASCNACVNSTSSCMCEMQWGNIDGFKNLCESTQVDGSHGTVYYLDMIRNPGSTRAGQSLAEKTVVGLLQNCYASSCEVPIIQTMATRNWYKNDPNLAVGSVSVRPLGQPYGATAKTTSGGLGDLPWWAWVLIAALVGLCIFGLIKVFRAPKRGGPERARVKDAYPDAGDLDLNMKGDMGERQPLNPSSPTGSHNMTGMDIQMPDMRMPGMDLQQVPTVPSGMDPRMGIPQMASMGGAGVQMPGMSMPGMEAPSMQVPGMQGMAGVQNLPTLPSMQPSLQAPSIPAPSSLQMPNRPSLQGSMSLQGFQGSMYPAYGDRSSMQGGGAAMPSASMQMAGPAYQAPGGMPSSPDNSLLAQAMQMSQQIESSGAQAIRSMNHAQFSQVGQPPLPQQGFSANYAAQPLQQTPSYQPAQNPYYPMGR